MFDIGFAELVIIGVVALLVIGPERLPGAIRTASAWLNRFRRGFNQIKQEVQQELHNDAVMQELKELRDSGSAIREETQSFAEDLRSVTRDAENTLKDGFDLHTDESKHKDETKDDAETTSANTVTDSFEMDSSATKSHATGADPEEVISSSPAPTQTVDPLVERSSAAKSGDPSD
ncbi:MAG: Sec-independent protein translocase protein TatB [Pseudomonadota bacterium]